MSGCKNDVECRGCEEHPFRGPLRSAENGLLAPRPGRSYCAAVESYDCLAPAGFRTGSGFGSTPGVRRSDLHTCAYCGESVCHNCSTEYGDLGRACDSHNEWELLMWTRFTSPASTGGPA